MIEGFDVNRTNSSNQYDICHFWYLLDKGFKFQPDVCNGCHDMWMIYMNLSDSAVLNINGVGYQWNWQKWGYKLNAKYRFDWKKLFWNIYH